MKFKGRVALIGIALFLAMTGAVVGEDVHEFINLDAVQVPEGTAAQPGLLLSDVSGPEGEQEGIYRSAEGEEGVGVSVNSLGVGLFKADGLHGDVTGDVDGGAVTADTITMSEGEGEGVITGYLVGNVLGNVTGNVAGATAGTHTGAVSLPDGAEGEPSEYYTNDTNTGRYRIGADEMGWVTGGVLRLRLSAALLTSTVPLVLPVGAVGAPSLYGTGSATTGFYFGTDQIYGTAGGVQKFAVDVSGVGGSRFISFSGGSAAVPALDCSGGGGYGIYQTGAKLGLARAGTAAIEYDVGAASRVYSAGTYTDTLTNYYTGAAHNTLTLRATRGTSASPDYLDLNDVVGTLKFEGMDGTGTWGDVAELRAVAVSDHASGDTHGGLHVYATKDGADTQTKVAGFESYIYAPGVLDLVLPRMDTRMVTFWDHGSDVGFGYFEDILAGLSITIPDGVSVFDIANAVPVRVHIGNDDNIYFANTTATVGVNTSFKFGTATGGIVAQQMQSGSYVALFGHDGSDFLVAEGSVIVDAAEAVYLGDPATDGSWRIIRNADDLLHQRRESGSWVTKQTITD